MNSIFVAVIIWFCVCLLVVFICAVCREFACIDREIEKRKQFNALMRGERKKKDIE